MFGGHLEKVVSGPAASVISHLQLPVVPLSQWQVEVHQGESNN
jgi:hypothetical protein